VCRYSFKLCKDGTVHNHWSPDKSGSKLCAGGGNPPLGKRDIPNGPSDAFIDAMALDGGAE
jgi:hypothetical protein